MLKVELQVKSNSLSFRVIHGLETLHATSTLSAIPWLFA
jgi:hypothetical protein